MDDCAEGSMDTLAERIGVLDAAGWTAQFTADADGVRCGRCAALTSADRVHVDGVFRFEGASDPDDESIVFALTPGCRHRGTLVAPYGPATPPEVGRVLRRLRSVDDDRPSASRTAVG